MKPTPTDATAFITATTAGAAVGDSLPALITSAITGVAIYFLRALLFPSQPAPAVQAINPPPPTTIVPRPPDARWGDCTSCQLLIQWLADRAASKADRAVVVDPAAIGTREL